MSTAPTSTDAPQNGWPWCTACGSCVIPSCKEGECDGNAIGIVLLWIFCMLVIGIGSIVVLILTLCCGTQMLGETRGVLARRRLICAGAFSCSLLAQIWSQLLPLYEYNPVYSFPAPTSVPMPPCATTKVTIGMWSAGRGSEDISSFLAPCASELHQLQAAGWFALIASVLTFVTMAAFFFCEHFWLLLGIACSATFFQIFPLALAASVATKSDFCGSGHSLLDLGFATASAIEASIVALVLLAVGGVVFLLIGKAAGWCDVDPSLQTPVYGSQAPVPQQVGVSGVAWQYPQQRQQAVVDATPMVPA